MKCQACGYEYVAVENPTQKPQGKWDKFCNGTRAPSVTCVKGDELFYRLSISGPSRYFRIYPEGESEFGGCDAYGCPKCHTIRFEFK